MALGRQTPTIILTADATTDVAEECRKAGVDAFLTKPLNTELLFRTVADIAARLPLSAVDASVGQAHELPAAVPTVAGSAANDDLLDHRKLSGIGALGEDGGFLEDLVEGFAADAVHCVEEAEEAITGCDYPRLQEALHALRGSAAELGAVAVVEACDRLRALKPFELPQPQARQRLSRLRATQHRTEAALRQLVSAPEQAGF
jgi:two-component system sensor histidine kinase RpfC